MRLWPLIKGMLTYVPGLYNSNRRSTGGTISARYCYSVWLRHLVKARHTGLPTRFGCVAELGPGDSLGIGLAAILCGADRYYALDVVEYSDLSRCLEVFEELVQLFRKRAPIPDASEFPEVTPELDCYDFPRDILDDAHLEVCLSKERLEEIRFALLGDSASSQGRIVIKYYVPWTSAEVIEKESVDLILSQAVLEHAEEIELVYSAQSIWLKPEGILSHNIDYRSHNITPAWNGHWRYSPTLWKLVKGRRSFLLNRKTHSQHVEYLAKNGFEIVMEDRIQNHSGLQRDQLSVEYHELPDLDLCTSNCYFLAVRVPESPKTKSLRRSGGQPTVNSLGRDARHPDGKL